jgi:hypothetical protein
VLVNAAAFSGPNSSRPIVIPDVMNMDALADVWAMIEKHLPAEYRSKFTWQQLAALLQRVAEGRRLNTGPSSPGNSLPHCSSALPRGSKT